MDLSVNKITQRIYCVRKAQIMLDNDLAEFFRIKTKALNQAVQRNQERFPTSGAGNGKTRKPNDWKRSLGQD